jgi:adenine/guanine phosphoribosyltransferase-like PRPP-binding protein
MQSKSIVPGQTVVVVDDIIATGTLLLLLLLYRPLFGEEL